MCVYMYMAVRRFEYMLSTPLASLFYPWGWLIICSLAVSCLSALLALGARHLTIFFIWFLFPYPHP